MNKNTHPHTTTLLPIPYNLHNPRDMTYLGCEDEVGHIWRGEERAPARLEGCDEKRWEDRCALARVRQVVLRGVKQVQPRDNLGLVRGLVLRNHVVVPARREDKELHYRLREGNVCMCVCVCVCVL